MTVDRAGARALAARAVARGEALGWFEELYTAADRGEVVVPWADLRPNPLLVGWPAMEALRPHSALVAGCGLGDDAEWLAARGPAVTAFDIAPSAVAACRRRFPHSSVDYVVADLLDPPPAWRRHFDVVVDAYTIQVLPPGSAERAAAFDALASVTGGTLLVIARGRHDGDDPGAMPWPLTAGEMDRFEELGMARLAFEQLEDPDEPGVLRFRAAYAASASATPS